MKLNDFPDEKTWSRLFSEIILKRGKDYWEDGAVGKIVCNSDKNTVSAVVFGSEDYQAAITLSEDGKKIQNMECSCPFAKDGNNCKHMAALLYAIEDENDAEDTEETEENNEYDDYEDNTEDIGTENISLFDELAEVINRLSVEELRRYLAEAAKSDPALRDRLLFSRKATVSPNLKKQWKQELDEIVYNAEDHYGWVDDLYSLNRALTKFLDKTVAYLSGHGEAEEAFRLVCAAYDKFASVEGDDSDGEYNDFFCECVYYWNVLLKYSTPELRRAVYPWFETNNGDDLYADAFAYMLTAFPDEELLHRQLDFIDRLIDETDPKHEYHLEKLIESRLTVMQKLSLPETELTAFRKKYHSFSNIRRQEIEFALSKKNYPEAEALLRESLILDHDKWGLTDEYHKQLLALFETSRQEEKYREELLDYVLKNSQSDLTYILKLKAQMPEQWETIRETLLTDSIHSGIRCELMENEGLYQRLFDAASNEYSGYVLLKYEKTLKKHFPVELRDLLLARTDRSMEQASTRKAYADIIASMKRIRTYPEGKEMLTEMVQRWKKEYRRPAMLEELKKAGF